MIYPLSTLLLAKDLMIHLPLYKICLRWIKVWYVFHILFKKNPRELLKHFAAKNIHDDDVCLILVITGELEPMLTRVNTVNTKATISIH